MGVTLLLLLSSLGLALPAQAQNCTRPAGGVNMNLRDNYILLDTFPDGSKVSFACAVGYMAAGGSPSITCTAGSWSPLNLKCKKVQCEEPRITNAERIEGSRPPHGYQSTVTYMCKPGYTMTGESTLTCGRDGQWSPGLPTCQLVTCDPPPTIVNGTFHPKKESYDYSDVVEYSCQKDYTLSGSRSIYCSAHGRFEPPPPACIKVQCEEPVIRNAEWIEGSQPPHGYQSTVTYMCKPGYTMTGESTLTCGRDGQWSPGLPTCQLRRCEEPHILHADRIGGRPPYGYQSLVMYKCKSGYKMIGEPTLTCGTDGRWSPRPPTCQPDSETIVPPGNRRRSLALGLGIGLPAVTCDPPPPVGSGTFRPDKEVYQYGDVVKNITHCLDPD